MKSKYTFNEIEEFLDKTSKLKISNVYIQDLLTSGKSIGTIKVDDTSYKLFAPSTYAHTEIAGLADNYLRKSSASYYGWDITSTNEDGSARFVIKNNSGLLVGIGGTPTEATFTHYPTYATISVGDELTFLSGKFNGVKKVLHEGNYESIIGNKFLKLSGGTLTGRVLISVASQSPLSVKNTAQEWVGLGFAGKNNSDYAFITYIKNEDGSESWGVTNDGWSKVSELLHSDNYYKYAPKLDGTGATGRWGIGLTAEELTDLNDARHGFLFTTTANYGTTDGNKPHKSHAAGLTWAIAGNSNYRAQLASASDDGSLYFRMMSYGTWGEWKTLAFTDSDITGNAATATRTNYVATQKGESGDWYVDQYKLYAKWTDATTCDWKVTDGTYKVRVDIAKSLATARTIWGQSFDGTEDVTGNLKLKNEVAIEAALKNGVSTSILHMSSSNNLVVGYGSSGLGISTYIDGNSVGLCYGTSRTLGFALNSSGNVTIGSSDLASTNHRLYVSGDTHIDGILSTYYSFKFLRESENYIAVPANGSLSFKVGDTVSTILNSHGNVTIGNSDYAGSDYKLFVHGEGRVSGGLSCIGLCGTRPTLGSAPSSGFIVDAYGKNTYGLSFWLENSGQSFVQSGRFDGDATAYALNLQPLGGNVGIGTVNPQAKLHVNGDTQVNGKLLGYYNSEFTYGLFANGPKSVYLQGANGGTLSICGTNASELDSVVFKSAYVRPNDTDISTLGTNAARWLNVFSVYGNVSSRLLVGSPTDSGWVPFQVKGAADIDGPLYISAHSKEGIYFNENGIHWHNTAAGWVSALMEFSSSALMLHQHTTINGDLKVTGNIIADGEVSAGITIPSGKSITFVDANGNNHILSGDDTAGGLKIDDKIITVN